LNLFRISCFQSSKITNQLLLLFLLKQETSKGGCFYDVCTNFLLPLKTSSLGSHLFPTKLGPCPCGVAILCLVFYHKFRTKNIKTSNWLYNLYLIHWFNKIWFLINLHFMNHENLWNYFDRIFVWGQTKFYLALI
jgi:hypothetical protein